VVETIQILQVMLVTQSYKAIPDLQT
jgi:hypothetical protein